MRRFRKSLLTAVVMIALLLSFAQVAVAGGGTRSGPLPGPRTDCILPDDLGIGCP